MALAPVPGSDGKTKQGAASGEALAGAHFGWYRVAMSVVALVLAMSLQAQVQALPKAAEPACRLVVLDLQSRDLADDEKDLAALLTESLATEAALTSGCLVITSADVREMMDFEAAKSACSETDGACMAEIGQALGAERIVGGSVGRLGNQWIVSARLMNVARGVVEGRTEQTATSPVGQRTAARNAARALFGQALLPPVAVTTAAETPSEFASSTTSTKPAAPSGLWWAGVSTASLGGLVALGGAGIATGAEVLLADPRAIGKSDLQTLGVVGLTVAGVGIVTVATGVVIAVLESP